MLMKLEDSNDRTLGFLASGRLTDNDYKNFLIPEVKAALEAGENLRLLFLLDGFRGWDIEAAWDDLLFGLEISRRVERIAIAGDRNWERWVARLVKAFAAGEVRYFELHQREAAWAWLQS